MHTYMHTYMHTHTHTHTYVGRTPMRGRTTELWAFAEEQPLIKRERAGEREREVLLTIKKRGKKLYFIRNGIERHRHTQTDTDRRT
jgi:hypothetical protein